MPASTPKVSVSIITYNHRNYIAQTLDSVLQQEVDFPYEIIVGDDCSTDGTRDILKEYQARHPDKIFLILHPKRYEGVPGRLNNITNLYACRGQYIAMLDGDDRWLSPDKLQQQANFLDSNPDYTLCFHDALIEHENPLEQDYYESERNGLTQNSSFTHRQLANDWFMHTSTVMFRNGLIGEFPEWFWHIYSADYAIQLLSTQNGKIGYLANVKGVRFKNQGSFTQQYSSRASLTYNQMRLNEMQTFAEHFAAVRQSATFRQRLAILWWQRARCYAKMRKYPAAVGCAFNSLLKSPASFYKEMRKMASKS
jgi:glycosyltransferase involved in cell wall biosynthesis